MKNALLLFCFHLFCPADSPAVLWGQDIYYLHGPDIQTDISETLDAIGELHAAGKIIEFGLRQGHTQSPPQCDLQRRLTGAL